MIFSILIRKLKIKNDFNENLRTSRIDRLYGDTKPIRKNFSERI
jgi:hypothetical protein